MKKIIYVMVGILIFVVVAGFITTEVIKSVTEKITRDITEKEVARITQEQVGTITQQETDRITAEETERIANEIIRERTGGIFGGDDADDYFCDPTPLPRQFTTTTYYTGPLIDAHLHMPSAYKIPSAIAAQVEWDPPVLDEDIPKGQITCLFDKENTKSALGFYIVGTLLRGSSVNAAEEMEEQYPGRITAFILPPHVQSLNPTAEQMEEIISDHPGLFKGLGEFGLYKGSFKGMSPEDPYFQDIYQLAAKHNLMVMIHPNLNQRESLERILKQYPTVTFLFHGSWVMGSYVTDIVARYPKAYFTIDTDLTDISDDVNSASLYGSPTKERFITDFKRDFPQVQRTAMANWKQVIEQHPDKFLWGTDRAYLWHFDPEVSAFVVESGRSFIGQLDPAVQEKFAWKNAQRLLSER